MKYTMRLKSVGNPDFRQYAPISIPKAVTGNSVEEMVALAEKYRDYWDLGFGNWTDPAIREGGKIVGFVRYNGTVETLEQRQRRFCGQRIRSWR